MIRAAASRLRRRKMHHAASTRRQVLAVLAACSRESELATLRAVGKAVPSVVLHGAKDPVIPWENGERLARAAGAAFVLLGGGHMIVPELIEDCMFALRSQVLDPKASSWTR